MQFDLDPPSYQQVTAVIRKMKASGSPCPLDQVSIISFKRCAYLRTYLTELVRAVWQSESIPSEWKKAGIVQNKDWTCGLVDPWTHGLVDSKFEFTFRSFLHAPCKSYYV